MKLRYVFVGLFLLLSASCGFRESNQEAANLEAHENQNIVDGIPVTVTDPYARHTVLIHYYQKESDSEPRPSIVHSCTGVIVGNKSILTAAHCFDVNSAGKNNYVEVYFTQNSENLLELRQRGLMINGINLIPYPSYEKSSEFANHFDLALVELAKIIPAGFTPVSILPAGVELKEGDIVTPVGFGKQVFEEALTNRQLKKSGGLKVINDWGTFFVMDQTLGKGVCSGDSGGPVFLSLKGQNFLVGISQGIYSPKDDPLPSCRKTAGAVKVQTYKTWILKNIEN